MGGGNVIETGIEGWWFCCNELTETCWSCVDADDTGEAVCTCDSGREPESEERAEPPFKRPIRLEPLVRATCPDPAATRINIAIVSKTSQSRGRARITGVVKNIGLVGYESKPTQQKIQLYSGSTLVNERDFVNIGPGEEIIVVYDLDWNSSPTREVESSPNYKLVISYNPSVTSDLNTRNDDCNSNNNQIEENSQVLNLLFSPKSKFPIGPKVKKQSVK